MTTPSPNGHSSGCMCTDCHPGLLAYSRDPDALERALEPLRGPVRLTIVTMPDAHPCDGTMTCDCQNCARERGSRRAAPPIRQPWEPRPARRAA